MTDSPTDSMTGNRRRGVAVRLAQVSFSLVVTLAMLELALRLATGGKYLCIEPRLAHGEVTYLPNQTQRFKKWEWDITRAINDAGFRDVARSPDQGSAGRIVALGSSFVEGYGVELEKTFPKQLQMILTDHWPGWFVYNAGHE